MGWVLRARRTNVCIEVLQNQLVWTRGMPLTLNTGASSATNDTAGHRLSDTYNSIEPIVVHSKDRIGAGFLTAVILILLLMAAWWMIA